ncbi:unnamed protein product [Moneuplotes crassus]|uniref:Uncharacterized protein n=1 Tax=Euplotes crassus TaxID=5936 RepID=A0AAD1UEP8_EUPCR|nr:unnamed protein product [Moneuplotes crassus]
MYTKNKLNVPSNHESSGRNSYVLPKRTIINTIDCDVGNSKIHYPKKSGHFNLMSNKQANKSLMHNSYNSQIKSARKRHNRSNSIREDLETASLSPETTTSKLSKGHSNMKTNPRTIALRLNLSEYNTSDNKPFKKAKKVSGVATDRDCKKLVRKKPKKSEGRTSVTQNQKLRVIQTAGHSKNPSLSNSNRVHDYQTKRDRNLNKIWMKIRKISTKRSSNPSMKKKNTKKKLAHMDYPEGRKSYKTPIIDKTVVLKVSPEIRKIKKMKGIKTARVKKSSGKKPIKYNLEKCLGLGTDENANTPLKQAQENSNLDEYLTRNSKVSDTPSSSKCSIKQAGENNSLLLNTNYASSLAQEVQYLESKKKSLLCDIASLEHKVKTLKDEKEALEMEKVQDYYREIQMRDHNIFL